MSDTAQGAPSRDRAYETSPLAIAAADNAGGGVAQLIGGIVGQAGSAAALKNVSQSLTLDRSTAARPFLMKAVRAINSGDFVNGKALALKGLERDEHNGFGWYLLAMALEVGGDFANSIRAYEAALRLIPDHTEVAHDLGRLAHRMGLREQAEKLYRHFLARNPNHPDAINNLATVIRDGGRYDEAIELLRPAIVAAPTNVMLWNTMGTVAGDMGDVEHAVIFFNEALRLDPKMSRARFNLSNSQQLLGEAEAALENCESALAVTTIPSDRAMMGLSRFSCLLAVGRLKDGWDQYEARRDKDFNSVTLFKKEGEDWTPGTDLCGKKLLVYGEQGLGDEILFANVLPDIVEALGPDGELTLGVEGRLIPLFKRSFPTATVYGHWTYDLGGRVGRMIRSNDTLDFDLSVPIASLLREYRPDHESFPDRVGYMKADPERVAHWRKVLEDAPPGPKVGLLWKSATTKGARHRFFSPLDRWRPVITTPGVTFVNLQYGDCEADLAYIKETMGVEVWQPPGIDLKQDLDEVAALCVAMDLIIGFSNATFNIGAACGVPSWLIAPMISWPRLGLLDRYLWYPQSRMFVATEFGAWDKPMTEAGDALRAYVAERQAA